MMDLTTIKKNIIDRLEKAATPERKKMASSNHPTAMKVLGVMVPDQKAILKNLAKELKKKEPRQLIQLAVALVDTEIMECQHAAYQILDGNKKALKELTAEDLQLLAKNLDNWVSVDNYAALIAGYAWREGKIDNDVVEEWARSDNFWMRRTAVVCTVALNQKARGGAGDPDRTLKICAMLADDKEDMVAKAMSWAIRELAKRDETPVIEFMEKYDAVLPKRVKREVKRKLETGRK